MAFPFLSMIWINVVKSIYSRWVKAKECKRRYLEQREIKSMQTVVFVIGANATGKTYFIDTHYMDKDVDIFNVYDYQQRAYDEAGVGKSIPFGTKFRCLMKANDMLLADIIEKLKQGRNVVVEQTLFKAKRRIAYIDEIRKAVDVTIETYVMCPSDGQWESNLKKRELSGTFQSYKEQAVNDIEFPNPAEGIDRIYEVVDDEIRLRMDFPTPEILSKAHEELVQETERIQSEDEAKRKRKELLESMKARPFWHYCEVCGKKEFIIAQDAFDSGWDYPPNTGHFGLLGPRTCGSCSLKDTLFWRVNTDKKMPFPIVVEEALTSEELVAWRRIKAEPKSLPVEEEM